MRTTALLLALLSAPAGLSAQTRPVPATTPDGWDRFEGRHLRVVDLAGDSSAVEGILLHAAGDTLILSRGAIGEPQVAMASRSVLVQEWVRTDPTRAMTIVGGVLGAATGGAIAALLNNPTEPKRCSANYDSAIAGMGCAIGAGIATDVEAAIDRFLAVGAGALAGGVIGAIIGRRMGRSSIREGWRPVDRPVVFVTPTVRGQVEVGLSIGH